MEPERTCLFGSILLCLNLTAPVFTFEVKEFEGLESFRLVVAGRKIVLKGLP